MIRFLLLPLGLVIVVLAPRPATACPRIVTLWESVELADAVVLGHLRCETVPWEQLVDPETAALLDRQERERPVPGGDDTMPWRQQPMTVAREIRIRDVWVGEIAERTLPLGNTSWGRDWACGPSEERSWTTDEQVLFIHRFDDEWSFLIDGALETPDRTSSRRVLRKAIVRARELQQSLAAEWRVLEWLTDLIVNPATRAAGLRDIAWGGWLRPESDAPPSPAELLSSEQRQRIAAAVLGDPSPLYVLRDVLEIVGDLPDPRIIETALDSMGRALDEAEGYWNSDQEMYWWFPETLDWFDREFECPWLGLWSSQLNDPDAGFLLDDVRAVWPEARTRIEKAVAKAGREGER